MPPAQRHVLQWSLVLALIAILCIFFVDRPVATALQSSAHHTQLMIGPEFHALEVIFGFPISKFLTGAVIVFAALVCFAIRRWRAVARPLLLLGIAQLATRLIAGMLKNVFLRPRPFEALDGHFFSAGSSFPSGHAAHFWPFVFVAMLAFPRLRIPALLLALFVSISRIAVNDHFVSDVAASAAIAALVSYLCALVILPKASEAHSAP
jgi:membrane-associated phospholipid phosphatase